MKGFYKRNNIVYPYSEITKNLRVSVFTNYLNDQSDPHNSLWLWSYHILIENYNDTPVKLIDRHWKITDASGLTQEVKGEGVIGKQPTIRPDNYFEYTSGTPLSTPSGIMKGTYQMKTPGGEKFEIEIPAFSLDSPHEPYQLN